MSTADSNMDRDSKQADGVPNESASAPTSSPKLNTKNTMETVLDSALSVNATGTTDTNTTNTENRDGDSNDTQKIAKEMMDWTDRHRFACQLILVFNFFGGIITDGLAPLVSVYLVSVAGWSPGTTGIIWAIREVSAVLSLLPMGDFVDKTKHKKTLLMISTVTVSLCSSIIVYTSNFWVLAAKSVVEGIASSALDPGKTGITLGITGQHRFEQQSSKNEIANNSGYLFFGAVCGMMAYLIYPNTQWVFLSIAFAGFVCVVSVALIPADLIKHDVARNINADSAQGSDQPVGYLDIVRDRSIMSLVMAIFCYHLGNGAVLPLVGQVIAVEGGRDGLTFTAICIIIARSVSVPATWWTGRFGPVFGYKQTLCVGSASLTVRCGVIIAMLFFVNEKRVLTTTQILDGIGIGVVGLCAITMTQLLTADTGRFNVTFAMTVIAKMLGGSCSNLLGGFLADRSYTLAFAVLAGISVLPVICVLFIRKVSKQDTIRQLSLQRQISDVYLEQKMSSLRS